MGEIQSTYKLKKYNSKDVVRILNPKQASFYWGEGCEPLDIYLSRNYETNEPVIVYIFNRKETQESGTYDKWCTRKPNKLEE